MGEEWKEEYSNLLKTMNIKDYSKALEIKRKNIPRYLYRYRTYNEEKINRIKREIYGFIYLSNIKDFNDPYDTRSILNNGKDVFIENLKDTYIKIVSKRFTENEKKEIFTKEKWFDEMLVKGLIKENIPENEVKNTKEAIKFAIDKQLFKINDVFNKILKEQIRITCFTPRCDNLPMWYHYANKYSGYCIEYDTTKVEFILYKNRLFPVNYVEKYRDIVEDIVNMKDYKKDIHFLIEEYATTKLKDWNYENEWRLILNLGMIYPTEKDIPEVVREKGPEIIFVKPSRIIIGANMKEDNVKTIEEECKERNVKMVRMSLSDSGIIIK